MAWRPYFVHGSVANINGADRQAIVFAFANASAPNFSATDVAKFMTEDRAGEIIVAAVREFGRSVDFGQTADAYAKWRQGFPHEFYERLEAFDVGQRGQCVLDLGTGTGTVARQLALQGSIVVGLDVAPEIMARAAELDRAANTTVQYVVGRAEAIEFASASFDVIMAAQCWHWFDRAQAAREVHRVLRPGGSLVIAHFDWLPLPGNVVAATENLILKYNPRWAMGGGTGIYPQWLADLGAAGFTEIETFSFDVNALYSHEAWRGRIQASAGVKASLSSEGAAHLDEELKAILAGSFPEDPLAIPHRTWAVVARKGNQE